MLRLFAAIPVPVNIGQDLLRLQVGLPGVRWSPLQNLHITLRFFGEIAEPAAEDLDLELTCIKTETFDLALEGAGAFGEGDDIRAVWVGVATCPALHRLAMACERAARRAGLKPETRAFRPHVTLAYLRRPDPVLVARWIQASNLFRAPPFSVRAFALLSSHATRQGSRYQTERVYPIN